MSISPDLINYVGKKRIEEQNQIKDFLASRGINQLFHFTRVQNLDSIIKIGLRPRDLLRGIHHLVSDSERIDQNYWGVSLSIGCPNAFMLRNKVKYSPTQDYIVLQYSARILMDINFLAFPGNAASHLVREYYQDNPFNLGGVKGLQRMFLADEHRDTQGLHPFETTDVQAEVMFTNPIPWNEYVTGVILQDYYSKDAISSVTSNPLVSPELLRYINDFDGKFFIDTKGAFDSNTQTRFSTKFDVDWLNK